MTLPIVALLIALWPSAASAYCRTPLPSGETSVESSCPSGGPLVSWRSRCLGFSVTTDTVPDGIDREAFEEVVRFAFREWTGVTCAGAPISLDAVYVGPTSCSFQDPERNAGPNVFSFATESSCAARTDGVHLGCTNVRVEPSGAIARADTVLNAAYGGALFLGTPEEEVPADKFDLRAVVVHEVGHFLGLAHSMDAGATMKSTLAPGARYRGLSADDRAAICDAYPPSGARHDDYAGRGTAFVASACSPEPFVELAESCAGEAPPAPEGSFQGCSLSRVPVSADGSVAAGVIVVALGFVAARRTSRRSAAAARTRRAR